MHQYKILFTALGKLSQEKFEAMLEAYKKYDMRRCCELAAIPMEMYMSLMSRDVFRFWNKLPIEYRKNREFQGYQRCTEHVNIPRIEFDNPPPMRRDCLICMRRELKDVDRQFRDQYDAAAFHISTAAA